MKPLFSPQCLSLKCDLHMATLKRTLSTKVDPNGKSEFLLRLTVRRGFQVRLKTGIFIEPDRYPDDAFIKTRPGSELNTYIRGIEKKLKAVEDMVLDVCQEESPEIVTKEYLQEKIYDIIKPKAEIPEEKPAEDKPKSRRGRPRKGTAVAAEPQEVKEPTFFEALEHFIATRPASTWRKKRYEVLMRALQRFEMYRQIKRVKTYKLTFKDFGVEDINSFETFLRSETELYEKYPKIYEKHPCDTRKVRKKAKPLPKGDNTIINMFACLRYFFRDCIELGYMDKQPFDQYKGNTTERYGTPYYITLEERDKIADHDFSANPSLEVQRDIFIFHTLIGCRVSDLYRLTPKDIINGAIEYIASKTLKDRASVIRVPLNQRGLDLIEKYKGKDPEGRLFPFISQQKYNVAIKKIFTECEITRMVTILNAATGREEKRPINELASSHLARRTFVGNLYKKVKDPNLVGSLSGHKDGSRAFARYREIDDDLKKELISFLD